MNSIVVRLPDGTISNQDYATQDTVRAIKLRNQTLINTNYGNIGVMNDKSLIQEFVTIQSLLTKCNGGPLYLHLICYDILQKQFQKLQSQYDKEKTDFLTQQMIFNISQEDALEKEADLTQKYLISQQQLQQLQTEHNNALQQLHTEHSNALQQLHTEHSNALQNQENNHQYQLNKQRSQLIEEFNIYKIKAESNIETLNNNNREQLRQQELLNQLNVSNLNEQISTLQDTLRNIQQENENLKNNLQTDEDDHYHELNRVKQENRVLRKELFEQKIIAQKVPRLVASLEQTQRTGQNLNQTIADSQTKIHSLEQIKLQLENQLQKTEKDKQESDRIKQQKIQAQEIDIQGLKDKLQSLNQEKQELQEGNARQARLIDENAQAIKQQIQQFEQDKASQERQFRSNCKTLNTEKAILETEIISNQRTINDLRNNLEQVIQQNAERFQDLIRNNQITIDQLESNREYQVMVIQELSRRIPNQYKPNLLGVVEKLKEKYATITDFANDESGSLTDAKLYIWKVEINQEDLEKRLIQDGKLLFNDLVKLYGQGEVNGKRTVNAIVSNADLQQGFIFQNNDSQANKSLLLMRQFKDLPPYFSNKEAAAQQAINNLLVDFMINDLNKQLVAKRIPKLDVKVATQYVVQIAGEPKFYHAEQLIDGPFTKFNGGEFALQASQQGQIANTLTYYSFKRTRGKLCISHLQSLGNTYYDAIVSSEYRLIGYGDLGPSEIHTVVPKIEKGIPEFLHPDFAKIMRR